MPAKKNEGAKPSKELATQQTGGVPMSADQMEFLANRAGQGAERVSMADIIMPRVNILQSLSPQLSPRKPEYVEGAKEGQIFNAATRRVMDKLRVLPCFYMRHHIEWKPNRQGFVADHGEGGAALMEQTKRNDNNYDVLPNGNLLVPTPTWYCLDLDNGGQQTVIPMPRTQSKPSRQWMSMATSERIRRDANDPASEFQPPLFFRSYDLGSTIREDDDNEWFVFTVERGPTVFELGDPSLMPKATQFRDMLASGEIKADASHFADDTGERRGGDSEDSDRPM